MAKSIPNTVINRRKITPDDMRTIITKAGGTFVNVEFTKKDGTLRRMTIQPATMAHRIVPDSEASESAKRGAETRRILHPNLIPVWDVVNAHKMARHAKKNGIPVDMALMRTACARSINTDTIRSVTVKGVRIVVE